MIVGSTKEDLSLEKRISITPEKAKNIINLGLKLCIEHYYDTHIGIQDKEYENLGVEIKNSSKEVLDNSNLLLKVNFPTDKDVIIYCDTNMDLDMYTFDSRIAMLNAFVNSENLWVMGFHQQHDEKVVVDQEHFEPHFDESYNMVFMQKLDELNKASETLEKIGYYKDWDVKDFQDILKRRSKK